MHRASGIYQRHSLPEALFALSTIAFCHVVFLCNQDGIVRLHPSVLFSFYFNSAGRPRHGMSAFVPLLRHGERLRSSTDLLHGPATPGSPVALRCDTIWLFPLRFSPCYVCHRPSRRDSPEFRPTRASANQLG